MITGAKILNSAGADVTESYDITGVNGLLTITAATDTVPNESVAADKTYDVGTGLIRVTIDCKDADGSHLDGQFASSQQVVGACATEQELAAVRSGETLEIRLDVIMDADATRAAESAGKTVIVGRLDGADSDSALTLGTFVKLELRSRMGHAVWTRLPSLAEKITVTIRIPPELAAKGASYCIAVPGENGYTLLADEDDDPDTITFTSGVFDTCAIVYEPAAQGSFVLFNLVATVLSLLFAVLCLLKKKKLRAPAAAAAALSVVVYLLLFSRGQVVLFDLWSILFGVLLASETFFLTRRESREEEESSAAAR